jgi:hypothetical protein
VVSTASSTSTLPRLETLKVKTEHEFNDRSYHNLSSTSEFPGVYEVMRPSKLGRNFDCPVTTPQILI